MARYTVDALKDKYEQLLSKVSNNSENWSEFLKKSAHLYKYSFLNQLLISEERPNARMVGTFEFWTKEKNSSVKGGVSGIPVLSKDNKVVYVFDINDTYSEYRERSLKGMNRVVVDTEIDNILSNLKINFTDNGIDKDKLTALINDSIRLTVYTKVGIDFASSNFDYIKQLSNIDVQTVGNYVSRQARKVLNSIGKYADYVEIKQQNTKDSKSYVHYNEDEIAIAKQTNLADYLRSIGEELRRVGTNEYEMAAHDSMRIEDGNRFYWNSQGFGGNTLDFLMKYYNMSFQEAVGSLLSFNGYSKGQSFVAPTRVEPVQAKEPDQPEPIVNPLPNELDTKTNRVYAYLTKTRHISGDIVSQLISEGKIAQDVKGNAVFKITDENGELSGAEITGTLTEKRYKQVTERNNNGFFIAPNDKPNGAIFFEAAIDLLSYYDLHRDTDKMLVSMAGLKPTTVLNMIERYNLDKDSCLISSDNDEAGKNFADKMMSKYGINSYRVNDEPIFNNYPNIKDWNDLLSSVRRFESTINKAERAENAPFEITDFERYNDLKVCDTPDILLQVGCEQLPIFYTQKHLRDALREKGNTGESIHHHGLDAEMLYDIPNQLANPVMIYDSLSSNNSIVIVTDKFDKDNLPIIAVIRPNGTAKYDFEIIDSNFMVSVYGRENFKNQVDRALLDDKLLYCNKEKSRVLFSVLGLQLSKGFNSFDFDTIIHKSNNIVNTKSKTKNEDLMTKTEKNSTVNVTFYQKDNDYVVVGDSAPKVADILHLDLKTVTLNFDEKIRLEAVIIPVALLYDNLDVLQEQGIAVEFDLFAKLQLNYAVKEHRDVFIIYKDEEKPEYSNYRFHHTSEGYRLMADKENEKDLYFLPDVMDYDDIYNFIMDSKTAKVSHYGSIAQNVLQDDEPQLSEKILNNMPDNTVSIAERNEYGYTSNYLLPLRTERATELLQNTDLPIYALHGDNTESQVESIEDIEEGGLFGVEYDQWEMYLDTQEHIREQQQVHNTIEIGDKFKNKISGEISEVVSLTGALSWYTDQCTVERESRGFVITENIDNARLLNTTLYEFIGNEKEQTVNLQTQVPVTDTVENSAQIEQDIENTGNINIEALANRYNEIYNELYNSDEIENYAEAIENFDKYVNDNAAFVKEFSSYIGDNITSDREIAAFMYALKELNEPEKEENITENDAQIEQNLSGNNIKENSVKFNLSFTESALLKEFADENPDMSFALANSVIEYLDEKQHTERENEELDEEIRSYYDKTHFSVNAVIDGENYDYDGRYDIGDGKGLGGGSIVDHIREYNEYYLAYEDIDEESKKDIKNVLNILVPYLEQNAQLTEKEQEILDKFKTDYPIRNSVQIEQVVETNNRPLKEGDIVTLEDKPNVQWRVSEINDLQINFENVDDNAMEKYSRTTEKKVAANNNNVFEQKEIDHILQLGINTDNGRMVVALDYMKGKSIEELTATLKQVYHGGYGLKDEQHNISVWYAEDGIHLAQGNSAEYVENAQVIPWEDVAVRIGELLENGQYATNVELVEAANYERQKIAKSLWYLYSDFADGIRETGILSSLSEMRGGGFSDDIVALAEKLTDPKFRVTLQTEYQAFMDAYKAKPDILRFHYHKVTTLEKRLKELDIHLREYQTDLVQLPLMSHFITEDEINHAMTRGSRFSDGKRRIWNYWQESHSSKEKADFLKNEYGTGGHSHALSGTSGSSEYYDSTGLRYKKNGCEEIKMSWIQAASRLDNLVHDNRYLTDKEKSEHYVNLEVNGKKEPVTEEVAADKAIDTVPKVPVTNYHINITDNELGIGGAKAKFTDNINSIKTLKLIENENRQATLQEQEILAKYVGWGGLQNAFDSRIDSWSKEYTELKSLLTDDEYTAARASVLDAHYTPPVIISSIYDTLSNLGFESGKILEPSMGIGNFFGLLPQSMQKSKLYGVELDSITGRIAKQLYPNANIQIKGFEKTAFNSNTFDVAIGNVPFGTTKISDNDFKEDSFIHDYFFKKSLDKVRPGGIVAFITSSGTLDKKGDKVKKYLAERADFLGAVRLPNNAFKNAGTPVVADIIFLQKKDRITELIDEKMPEWVNVSDFGEHGTHINNYFVNHPEMVCGTLGETTSQYGYAVTCKPSDIPLEEQLKNALSNIKGTYEPAIDDVQVEEKYDMPNVNVDNYRNFCYAEIDGEIYFRENERLIKEPVTGKKTERLKGMIEISSVLQELIAAELQDYDDENTSNLRNKLNAVYDKFTAKFGILSSKTNKSLFREDDTAPLLLALENIDKDGNLESKSDIFTKRTIQPYTTIDHTDTAVEALAVSISEKGRVDVDYMAQLCGTTEEDIVSELKGVIFENPVTNKYENADEYLSGNVKEKLKIAKDYAQFDSKFNINVSALTEVQPPDLKPEEISVQLGSTWVPVQYYQQFMYELLETPSFHKNTYGNAFGNRHSIVVDFNSYSSQYKISNAGADRDNIKASVTYGTSRVSAYELIEDTLNLKNTVVNDRIIDENDKPKYVQNKKETLLAQEKQDIIKQRFKEWIFDDYDRTQDIVKIYNDKFNSIRLREYDGSHITFKGMSSEITLRKHQVDAIAHTLYGGNTLLAHSVGAGKSFEMIASAMESKRLGLCHKSLIVVPKAIVAQMSADFLRLYPTANILVPKATDFNAENRQKFCSRIATGNYDAVIISHEQLDKIPLSVEYQTQFIQERLDEVEDYLLSTKYANDSGNRGFTIKQLESTKKNLENRLEALNNDDKRDTTITFEELGVDKIYVDEAHLFKNKYFNTKMSRVAGISTSAAQRSEGLYMKCRYLDEKTGSRGVVFATGTPISNSMVEMYTMQTYLQFDELKRHDLHHFDAWASTFGETVLSFELAPEGKGYQYKTRFAKFNNISELMDMFKSVADIKTADMLDLPTPKANYHTVAVEASEYQKQMIDSLAKRAEKIRAGKVDNHIDNMPKITGDGKKIALDQRLMNPMLPDDPNSKVNACINNVFDIYKKTTTERSTQIIFCDQSTPDKNKALTVYDDVKTKLIAMSVSPSEIAVIHDYSTDAQKIALFQRVQKGDVRILLGSTSKLGTGTNCQNKLKAVHHLDCPWKPSDIEQRNGRIIRQGNENSEVDIYTYVTKNTFDAYLYQLVENKQKFISQIMTSKSYVRSATDIDECVLNYAEIKAIASGDPKIKEKIDLEVEVNKLRALFSSYQENKRSLQKSISQTLPKKISALQRCVENFKIDSVMANEHKSDKFTSMTIDGVTYTDKKEAGAALLKVCKTIKPSEHKKVGNYRGFDVIVGFNTNRLVYSAELKGRASYDLDLGSDIYGNFTRFDNAIKNISVEINETELKFEKSQKELEDAKIEIEKPFEQLNEMREKENRLKELNSELSGHNDSENIPDEETGHYSIENMFESAAYEVDAHNNEVVSYDTTREDISK